MAALSASRPYRQAARDCGREKDSTKLAKACARPRSRTRRPLTDASVAARLGERRFMQTARGVAKNHQGNFPVQAQLTYRHAVVLFHRGSGGLLKERGCKRRGYWLRPVTYSLPAKTPYISGRVLHLNRNVMNACGGPDMASKTKPLTDTPLACRMMFRSGHAAFGRSRPQRRPSRHDEATVWGHRSTPRAA
jgi:hypothetical protein